MATYSGASAQHQTLTASTVDTVTLDEDYNEVEVLNRSTSSDIYFVIARQVNDSGNAVTQAAPTVGGAGTYVVPAGQSLRVPVKGSSQNTVVELISSGTPAYSVTGV